MRGGIIAATLMAFSLAYCSRPSHADFNGTNGFVTVANPANGVVGTTGPATATQVAGQDPGSILRVLKTDTSGHLVVDGVTLGGATETTLSGLKTANHSDLTVLDADLATLETTLSGFKLANHTDLGTVNTTLGSPFQAGGSIGNTTFAATQATASSLNATVVAPAGAALALNSSLTTINTTLGTPMQNSGGSVMANLGTIGGAATAANQTTANTSLSSIDTKLTSPLTVNATLQAGSALAGKFGIDQTTPGTTNGVVVNSSALPAGAATSANQSTQITSLSTIATNSAKTPINTTGSGSAAGATVSTVITLTAPANAVGFVLMNLDTSTANIRWAVGRTATTTLGQQLQPGRDTGFVPIGANISVVAESGTQTYDVQWVSQ